MGKNDWSGDLWAQIPHDIEIRRVAPVDGSKPFSTQDKDFDRVNPSGTLAEYCNSDERMGGSFWVFIIVEKVTNDVVGLIRVRNELDGGKIDLEEIQGKPAFYFSRIGTVPQKRRTNLGRILFEFALYVTRSEARARNINEFWFYWKCRDNPEVTSLFSSFVVGTKILRSYYGWGPSVIMGALVRCYDTKEALFPAIKEMVRV